MSVLQKQTFSQSLEKFVSSPYALLVVAGAALACVMACAVGMALALAPGIAQTRAIILNAEAARVAEEKKAATAPTSAAAKPTGAAQVISPTAVVAAPIFTPPPTPTTGKQSLSPVPSPTLLPGAPTPQRSPTPAATSFTPVVPVIATTVAPVLPPTFTAAPGATAAPTAGPSPTTAAQAPAATPTATSAPNQEPTATNTPAPTATTEATPTPVVYPPGATLISGTIKITAVHPDFDYPANEYIELTNVGAQNVALQGLHLIINNPALDPPAMYTFGGGIVLEPGFTCRVFTGLGGSGGGGTSLSCSGLSFKDRNASLFQSSGRVEARDEKSYALLAVYVYVR